MIKAIETHYGGCRFRSRAEARWAVYFDTLGVKWEYEKEGYELPSGKYLPDFWLPEPGMWAEVKGAAFTRAEYLKCVDLVRATGSACLLLVGMPGETVWGIDINEDGETYPMDYDLSYWEHEGRFFYCVGLSFPETQQNCMGDKCKATTAAKSARFEFGQAPRRKGRR